MGHAYQDRELGAYGSFETCIDQVCLEAFERRLSADEIAAVSALHYDYIRSLICHPSEDTVEALRGLKEIGLPIGLVTNCGPAVPKLWHTSPLKDWIDVPVFSCVARTRKPDRDIYLQASSRLNVSPRSCLYVGDGSSDELSGAAGVGMRPVLKRVRLDDVYDQNRRDVDGWAGETVDTIGEVLDLVADRKDL